MSDPTHGIIQFKATGVVSEKVKGRKRLISSLNRLEKELKLAVRHDNIKSDIQIGLLRYCLTITGLFSLYSEEVGLFDPGELRKHRLEPQPVFKFILPAINTASRILERLDCGVKVEDAMKRIEKDQKEYLDRVNGKRKRKKTKGKTKGKAKRKS
ncbi:hypothetical protein ES703_18828 [subsurface metagenome]